MSEQETKDPAVNAEAIQRKLEDQAASERGDVAPGSQDEEPVNDTNDSPTEGAIEAPIAPTPSPASPELDDEQLEASREEQERQDKMAEDGSGF